MTKPHYTHVYIKLRRVPPRLGVRGDRMSHNDATYEGKIIGRIEAGRWGTLATSRGHLSMNAARDAILKLADRREIKVTDDPRGLRMLEFTDRYGDDIKS